jgi:hypothetical protein
MTALIRPINVAISLFQVELGLAVGGEVDEVVANAACMGGFDV